MTSEIKVGDKVHWRETDGPALGRVCGPAVVLALDKDPAWDAGQRNNRPSAWIRYTSPDGFYRYRSVDVADLEETDGAAAADP